LDGLTGGRLSPLLRDSLRNEEERSWIPEIRRVRLPNGALSFFLIGDIPRWRVDTLLTKEPETISWIDRFPTGSVFWDIGANIGLYTLYAAVTRSARVLAFEPSASNYLLLDRSIAENALADRVSAYCMAFSGMTEIGRLALRDTAFGTALSSYSGLHGSAGSASEIRHYQGMLGFSLDNFLQTFQPPFPNYLKLDIDGGEPQVLEGGRSLLSDARLKGVMAELDKKHADPDDSLHRCLRACGLRLADMRHGDHVERSPFATIYNFFFER
jgi:FkbM family methyltransferase